MQPGSQHYGQGHHKAWQPTQAVDRRADGVPGIYRQKARTADTKYNGLPASRNTAGPVESELAKYKVIGLAVGAYGEVSKSMHRLMGMIAHNLAGKVGNDLGMLSLASDSWEAKLAFATQYVRREMSSCIARERAYCLLSRFRSHSSLADPHPGHAAGAALGDFRSEPDLAPWVGGD